MSANMIVGRVDTYGHSGNVENRRTFTDYRQFKRQVLHDLNCGRPIVIVANKIPGIGVRTPTQWVTEEGGLPVGGVKYECMNEKASIMSFVDRKGNRLFEMLDGESLVFTKTDGQETKVECHRVDQNRIRLNDVICSTVKFARWCHQQGITFRPEFPSVLDCIDTYEIHQIPFAVKTPYRFSRFSAAEPFFSASHYQKMYCGMLAKATHPEELYLLHNQDNRPFGAKMHSMTVSDVVVLNRRGKRQALYVDTFGFVDVTDRFPPQKTVEKKKETSSRAAAR